VENKPAAATSANASKTSLTARELLLGEDQDEKAGRNNISATTGPGAKAISITGNVGNGNGASSSSAMKRGAAAALLADDEDDILGDDDDLITSSKSKKNKSEPKKQKKDEPKKFDAGDIDFDDL